MMASVRNAHGRIHTSIFQTQNGNGSLRTMIGTEINSYVFSERVSI